MGKTIINVAITMADDEWDRFDKRFEKDCRNALPLLEEAINNTVIGELGIMAKAKVTKIE